MTNKSVVSQKLPCPLHYYSKGKLAQQLTKVKTQWHSAYLDKAACLGQSALTPLH